MGVSQHRSRARARWSATLGALAVGVGLVTAAPAQAAPAPTVGKPVAVGGVQVYQSTVDPTTNTVYVAAYGNSAVYTYDGATGQQKQRFDLPGAGPLGLAVDPATRTLYAANAIEDVLTVLDADTGAVRTRIDRKGKGPREIRIDSAAKKFYVVEAHAEPGLLAEYDATTNTLLREIPTGGKYSSGLALDPAKKLAYVPSFGSDDISVIDLGTGKVTRKIATGVGSQPTGAGYDPKTGNLLVSLQGFGSVETLSTTDWKPVTAPVATGKQALGVTVDSEVGRAYVTNFGGTTLSVVDTKTGAKLYDVANVGTFPINGALNSNTHEVWVSAGGYENGSDTLTKVTPRAKSATATKPAKVGDVSVYESVVDPATNTVYVTSFGNSAVYAYDGATGKLKDRIVLPQRPMGLAFNGKTRTLYTTDALSNTVQVVNARTKKVTATVALPDSAREVRVDEATNRFYVSEVRAAEGSVAEFDGRTNTLLRRLPTGGAVAAGLAVDSAGKRLYATNFRSGTVAVIDLATGTRTALISTGDGSNPTNVAVNPSTKRAYVTLQAFNTVTTLDTTTNKPVGAPVTTGNGPLGVSVDVERGRVYVTNYRGNSLATLDATTGKRLSVVTGVGTAPISPALNTNTGEVWVSAGGFSGGSNTVTKVTPPSTED